MCRSKLRIKKNKTTEKVKNAEKESNNLIVVQIFGKNQRFRVKCSLQQDELFTLQNNALMLINKSISNLQQADIKRLNTKDKSDISKIKKQVHIKMQKLWIYRKVIEKNTHVCGFKFQKHIQLELKTKTKNELTEQVFNRSLKTQNGKIIAKNRDIQNLFVNFV